MIVLVGILAIVIIVVIIVAIDNTIILINSIIMLIHVGINVDNNRNAFKAKNIPKTPKQEKIIKQSIEENFFLATLDNLEKRLLLQGMEIITISPGENIITEGEVGDYFYIIETGKLSVLVNGTHMGYLTDGKSFGELALMHNTPRSATIRAETMATLFSLDRDTFRFTVAHGQNDRITAIKAGLKMVPILEGKDIIAAAQTGTGKTAAFLLPLLHRLLTSPHHAGDINALVIVPTRELAIQIAEGLEGLAYFTDVSSIAVYGGGDGNSFAAEKKALTSGADIVVCTPGRMIAHLNMGYVKLKGLKYLVLDEADRMLDMGFEREV